MFILCLPWQFRGALTSWKPVQGVGAAESFSLSPTPGSLEPARGGCVRTPGLRNSEGVTGAGVPLWLHTYDLGRPQDGSSEHSIWNGSPGTSIAILWLAKILVQGLANDSLAQFVLPLTIQPSAPL